MIASHITDVTRRRLTEGLARLQLPWSGGLGDVDFLGRLYDLDDMPSTGRRHATAGGDIFQHRILNLDWDNAWILRDERFGLAEDGDALLALLADMLPASGVGHLSAPGRASPLCQKAKGSSSATSGKMSVKHSALVEALTGRFDDHHAELARMLLDQIDASTRQIDTLTARVEALIAAIPAAAAPQSYPGLGAAASTRPVGWNAAAYMMPTMSWTR